MTLSGMQTSDGHPIVLRAEGVWKSYDDGAIAVLKGVDFEAAQGQTIALCGPSGCGKSTLLHLFGGLDAPDRGLVSVNGVEVNRHRSLLRLLPLRKWLLLPLPTTPPRAPMPFSTHRRKPSLSIHPM